MTVLPSLDAERLERWDRDGYVIVEGAVAPERIDAMFADIDRFVWDANAPDPAIEILNASVRGGTAQSLSHSAFLALPDGARDAIRTGAWRLADFFMVSPAANRIATDGELSRQIDMLLGRASKVRSSVTLLRGGETRLHQDAVLFACEPFNMTVTIGLACEDVAADAGPLLLYPGSHNLPIWHGWTDYPRTMLKTCDAQTADEYHCWLESHVDSAREHRLMLRKGDAILWHASLAHRASKPANPERTLKLCVLHSFPDGCDRTDEILEAYRKEHHADGGNAL